METAEVMQEAFRPGDETRIMAPPHLAREAAQLRALLAGGRTGEIIFASSGTSGEPKWVALHREALMASAEAVNRRLEARSRDRWLLALPVFHVGGFGILARARAAGGTVARLEGKWNPRRFAAVAAESGATITSLVPAQLHDLVAAKESSPPALRAVVVGGGAAAEEILRKARRLGWPVLRSYGMTEAASQVATDRVPADFEGGTPGPLPALEVWECRQGPGGRLEIRGRPLFNRYLHADRGRLVESDPKSRGWFTTSDVVKIHPDGLEFKGRADRLVKILGELLDLQDLETRLRQGLPQDAACVVVAVPDHRRGWRLVPVAESAFRKQAARRVAALNRQLPGFARLESLKVVTKLPRTPLGKWDYAALRDEIPGAGSS